MAAKRRLAALGYLAPILTTCNVLTKVAAQERRIIEAVIEFYRSVAINVFQSLDTDGTSKQRDARSYIQLLSDFVDSYKSAQVGAIAHASRVFRICARVAFRLFAFRRAST